MIPNALLLRLKLFSIKSYYILNYFSCSRPKSSLAARSVKRSGSFSDLRPPLKGKIVKGNTVNTRKRTRGGRYGT